jgi:pyridoxine 5-phosphate synthase
MPKPAPITAPRLPLLGVNIDHVATLRQLRGTPYPDLLEAARLVESAGAHQITVHLREDRRHIQDDDVKHLRAELRVPLNLEMAATEAMIKFASRHRPDWACLVPEKRQEVTTEGGLDIEKGKKRISDAIRKLQRAGIKVSLFIEPSVQAVRTSHELGADAVELHTGRFCLATQGEKTARTASRAASELDRIRKAAALGRKLGVGMHAGHGFDYENVRQVVALKGEDGRELIEEYNIGHSIVCRAALVGMERAVREMLSAIHAP